MRLRGFLLVLEAHDILMLERAFSLAEKARGCTSPNPVVGAVVVREAHVIGEGYHSGPGKDHAEIAAMKDAVRRAGGEARADEPLDREAARAACAGATMYVTLEPCCTYGRTPPCTDALVAADLSRVVVGSIDPSPGVNGRGVDILRGAGISVEVAGGDIALRMKRQNDGMRKSVVTGLPFVTYKYAMTVDGRTATDSGDSRWISSAESRLLVHRWRAASDAVVVGSGTVRADDPLLTAREVECCRQPLRVVVGDPAALAVESALVRSAAEHPVVVLCGGAAAEDSVARLKTAGVEVETVACGSDGRPLPVEVLRVLTARGVQTVLLEGGRTLAGAWWRAGMIDKVACFLCPKVAPGVEHRGAFAAEGAALMAEALVLKEVHVEVCGPDVLLTGYTGEAH